MTKTRANYTPFVYLLDDRYGHECNLMGCAEPAHAVALFKVDIGEEEAEEEDISIGLCLAHFVALQRTAAHPHGEEPAKP